MSKEIFLYSADNKYQAYVELADNTDRFGCPDHSFFTLIENRNDDKLYLIAEARDGLLETEKDQHIVKLEQELAELKEKLSKATQFETPHIERFALVRYFAQKNEPYKIVNCYDCYRDKDYKIHYCFYNVKSMNFKLIEVFATEQEAQAKLKELRGGE